MNKDKYKKNTSENTSVKWWLTDQGKMSSDHNGPIMLHCTGNMGMWLCKIVKYRTKIFSFISNTDIW